MGIKKIFWIIAIVLLITGCGAPKVLTSFKTNAETFTTTGNFVAATEAWKQYFNQTTIEETAGADFANAAKTAFKSGETDLSLSWFDQARYKNYSDFEMYKTLAEIQHKKKNISKELTALEYIVQNYNNEAVQINDRLFDVYYEIDAKEQALQVWQLLDETSKSEISKIESYFLIHKSLKDTTICDSVSLVLLEKNPVHVDALEWNAKKYYWMGENGFQRAMVKYNANKTTRQYRILLKELDKSTADFKRSLYYFEKLWKIEPGKKYASYFANIYARFGDEKKSKYYQKYR